MKKTILSILIFALSVAVYYYPVHSKGYVPDGDFTSLAMARNAAVSATYTTEGAHGEFLSADRLQSDGQKTAVINPLTPMIYGYVFRHTGVGDRALSLPIYTSIVLAALFNVVIFLLICRIFTVRVGLFSAAILIFMPVRVLGALHPGSHEFAMLFFAGALWLALGSKEGPDQASMPRLFLASVFFAFAALARNAFLISFIPLVLYEGYQHRSVKRVLILLVPFIIIFGSTLTPLSWLGMPNGYTAGIDSQPVTLLGELFPDPYTAYYHRAEFIAQIQQQGLDRSGAHFLAQWGYPVSVGQRLAAWKDSLVFYVEESVSLTNFGGPIIVLLVLAGAYCLWQKKKELLIFFGVWLVVWIGALVYFETANGTHFLEIIFIIALLAGLGMDAIIERIQADSRWAVLLSGLLVAGVAGHLAYADRWRLYDAYRSSYEGGVHEILPDVRALSTSDTIAVGSHPYFAMSLYYLTNRNIIYFNPDTVSQLVKNGKLKEAFELYQVRAAVGFSADTSHNIQKLLSIPVIPWQKGQ